MKEVRDFIIQCFGFIPTEYEVAVVVILLYPAFGPTEKKVEDSEESRTYVDSYVSSLVY